MVADQSRKGPMFADVICRRLSAAEKAPPALTLSPTRPSTASSTVNLVLRVRDGKSCKASTRIHRGFDFKREIDYMLNTWITRETMETIRC